MNQPYQTEAVQQKWAEIIDHPDLPPIKDPHRRAVTACMLENTERELKVYQDHSQFLLSEAVPTNSMSASSSTHGDGAIDTFDPILISLLRRAMPNLIAYDLCGVQQMTGPTGLVFAMRSRYVGAPGNTYSGTEAFYNEANTAHSARGGANTAANTVGSSFASNTVVGGAANNIGTIPVASNGAGNSTYNHAGGITRFGLEAAGSNSTAIFPEMGFSIER